LALILPDEEYFEQWASVVVVLPDSILRPAAAAADYCNAADKIASAILQPD